jgi:hypothetical protein
MFEYMFNGLRYLLGYEPMQTVAEIATCSVPQATQASNPHILLLKKNDGYKNVNSNTVLDYAFNVFE